MIFSGTVIVSYWMKSAKDINIAVEISSKIETEKEIIKNIIKSK
jgi:glycine betaine/choline ABC-type transport system substrate-binding protein